MVMSSLVTFDWLKKAKELASNISINQLHPECIRFLLENHNEPWAITCSGGADSLSLLLLIYGHFFEKNKSLTVLHYNHKLRNVESDNEEVFVRNCCKALNLSLICGEGDPFIKDRSEASLRKKRHEFFSESLKKIGGRILLFGHQKDDIAETLLMRLARGSGTGGLCAPRPLHFFKNEKIYVRPLLSINKKFLLEILQKLSIPWCTDSSNEGEYYFRNRIRKNVIPEWEAASLADLWKGVEKSRGLLEEDDIALEKWLEQTLDSSQIKKYQPFGIQVLIGKPKALYRRFLHKWLQVMDLSRFFNSVSFDILLEKIFCGKNFQIHAGSLFLIILQEGVLNLEKINKESTTPTFEEKIGEEGSVKLIDGSSLKVEEIVLNEDLKERILKGKIDPNYEVYIKFDKSMQFRVRFWQEGDRYKPLGSPGSRKLQDMFTDRKIARERRRILPIIYEKNQGIVWCPGLPIADASKIDEATIFALKLTYK